MAYTFADLFAGIGGMRIAFERAGAKCVWANDIDEAAAKTYRANFGEAELVVGDVRKVDSSQIPPFDILVAGFPCQPFSIAGVSKNKSLGRPHGFEDTTRGTLFHEIARIMKDKKPQAYVLENVKNLLHHDNGRTFRIIQETIEGELGYSFYWKVYNANRVLPQNRERIFIVGFRDRDLDFSFPELPPVYPPLSTILESKPPAKYILTDHLWNYLKRYAEAHRKRGNGFGYGLVTPEGQTRTLSARYYKDGSEILVAREGGNPRRLTPRECARLQGFPDTFIIPVSDTQAYKQFGNAVPVPVVEAIAREVLRVLDEKPRRKRLQKRITEFFQ